LPDIDKEVLAPDIGLDQESGICSACRPRARQSRTIQNSGQAQVNVLDSAKEELLSLYDQDIYGN